MVWNWSRQSQIPFRIGSSYGEFTGTPIGFPLTGRNEVFTYMLNLQLKAFSNCIYAGQLTTDPPYDQSTDMVKTGTTWPSIYKSIGRTVSRTPSGCSGVTGVPTLLYNDYDNVAAPWADSFWDMYVNVYIPPGSGTDVGGFVLYNDPADPDYGAQPLIIRNSQVDALPPNPIYYHGASTTAALSTCRHKYNDVLLLPFLL